MLLTVWTFITVSIWHWLLSEWWRIFLFSMLVVAGLYLASRALN